MNTFHNTPQHTKKEGEMAVEVVKAMKSLKEKGISTNGLSNEEIINTHYLMQVFSNIKR